MMKGNNNRASCKTVFSSRISVMLKILSHVLILKKNLNSAKGSII